MKLIKIRRLLNKAVTAVEKASNVVEAHVKDNHLIEKGGELVNKVNTTVKDKYLLEKGGAVVRVAGRAVVEKGKNLKSRFLEGYNSKN